MIYNSVYSIQKIEIPLVILQSIPFDHALVEQEGHRHNISTEFSDPDNNLYLLSFACNIDGYQLEIQRNIPCICCTDTSDNYFLNFYWN